MLQDSSIRQLYLKEYTCVCVFECLFCIIVRKLVQVSKCNVLHTITVQYFAHSLSWPGPWNHMLQIALAKALELS